jgi:thiol-disulfide isomerase/thioredoxin
MDTMNTKFVVGFLAAIVVLVGAIAYFAGSPTESGPSKQYDLAAFGQCLKDKGAVFYGAFWCPHCQATKRIFGAAKSYLPYVECSTPDGQSQLPICVQKGIASYPTWVFADGSRIGGELSPNDVAPAGLISLNDLAQKTNCQLISKATGQAVPIVRTSISDTTATSSASSAAR